MKANQQKLPPQMICTICYGVTLTYGYALHIYEYVHSNTCKMLMLYLIESVFFVSIWHYHSMIFSSLQAKIQIVNECEVGNFYTHIES